MVLHPKTWISSPRTLDDPLHEVDLLRIYLQATNLGDTIELFLNGKQFPLTVTSIDEADSALADR